MVLIKRGNILELFNQFWNASKGMYICTAGPLNISKAFEMLQLLCLPIVKVAAFKWLHNAALNARRGVMGTSGVHVYGCDGQLRNLVFHGWYSVSYFCGKEKEIICSGPAGFGFIGLFYYTK